MSPVRLQVAEVRGAGADGGRGPAPQLAGPAALEDTGAPALPGQEGDLLPPAPRHQAGLGGQGAGDHPLLLGTEPVAVGGGGVVVAGVALEARGETQPGHQDQEGGPHGNYQ